MENLDILKLCPDIFSDMHGAYCILDTEKLLMTSGDLHSLEIEWRGAWSHLKPELPTSAVWGIK